MPVFTFGAALGALLAYFLDPQNGTRRRHMAIDRTAAFFRSRARESARAGRGVAADAHGVSQKLQHRDEQPKDYDDATLADKVRTEIFRPEDAPKGDVNVNVQDGVVQLRGEVQQEELIEDLVERTRNVQGVRGVENLMHLPGTPAPTHE